MERQRLRPLVKLGPNPSAVNFPCSSRCCRALAWLFCAIRGYQQHFSSSLSDLPTNKEVQIPCLFFRNGPNEYNVATAAINFGWSREHGDRSWNKSDLFLNVLLRGCHSEVTVCCAPVTCEFCCISEQLNKQLLSTGVLHAWQRLCSLSALDWATCMNKTGVGGGQCAASPSPKSCRMARSTCLFQSDSFWMAMPYPVVAKM